MRIINLSEKAVVVKKASNDPINVFCQFFIPTAPERITEIQKCLRFNVENPYVTAVYLLNERIYTDEELGIASEKIVQINIGRRLKFSDVFAYIDQQKILGYNVIVNSDIFVDKTIEKLRKSDLHVTRKMMALLRFEYDPTNVVKSKVFGPRHDSQDTWILHSNFNIPPETQKAFAFEFGKPGCDNKIIYLMNILGYDVVNDPTYIKTYHVHKSQTREYTIKDRVPAPYAVLSPYGYSIDKVLPAIGVNLGEIVAASKDFNVNRFNDNVVLHDYVGRKVAAGQKFIIPRIAGLENNVAVLGEICKNNGQMDPQSGEYFNKTIPELKKTTGVYISTPDSITQYSELYMGALGNAELIGGIEVHGKSYAEIQQSYEYVRKKYKQRKFIWTAAFEVYHYLNSLPWTFALRGKRILVISPFAKQIQEVLPHHEKIFGVDLFPECTLSTIPPPQKHGNIPTYEFSAELANFCGYLDTIKDTYDVALVSCGESSGFGNLICNHVYTAHGKAAIYIGDVLSLYFGILEESWLRERPDIVMMYANSFWRRVMKSPA